jgi:hypothetical protein
MTDTSRRAVQAHIARRKDDMPLETANLLLALLKRAEDAEAAASNARPAPAEHKPASEGKGR